MKSPQSRRFSAGYSHQIRPLISHLLLAQGDRKSVPNLKAKSLVSLYLYAMLILLLTFLSIKHHRDLRPQLLKKQNYFLPSMASSSKHPVPKEPSQMPENLLIPKDENDTVVLSDCSEAEDEDLTKRMLVGMIITSKNLNRTAIRNAFKQMWENHHEISILEGGNYTFAFTFQKQEEATKIWDKNPWGSQTYVVDEWGDLTPPTP